LSIGGDGMTVDWLVVMRRLDESQTLENTILEQRVEPRQLNRLAASLVRFYRQATPVFLPAAVLLRDWQQNRIFNRRVLLDPRCGLPCGLVTQIDNVQRRFLSSHSKLLAKRLQNRRIVDGHGDMRPEHIWLDDPVKVIDCLEFNPRLRAVDPFDEIAFLSIECERFGAGWVGEYIRRRVARGLRDDLPQSLFLFYRCQRATLRARLAIAHMLEPSPRTPEKWPGLARAYLQVAAADARRIERRLRKRAGR
jgi:aminoglycoside phosphotransferase family enzyme